MAEADIKGAIPNAEDVPVEPPPATPEKNPRNAHLDALTAQSRAARQKQMEDAGFVAPAAAPAATVEEDPEPAPAPEPKPAAVKQPEPAPVDEDVVTLKVEGQEVRVPKSKVYDAGQRALQKEMAADRALADAKRLRAEAEEYLAQAKSSKGTQQDADLGEKLSDIADRLQFGDKEEGKKALQEYADLVTAKSGNIDVNALEQKVTQQVIERTEFEQATAFVNEKYSDVMGDPILRHEFLRREDEARNAGDVRTYKDLYIAIAEDLRSWKNGLSPTATAGTLEDRRRRKQESSAPPGGQTVSATPLKEPPKPKTAVDIIAQMRKARGQG